MPATSPRISGHLRHVGREGPLGVADHVKGEGHRDGLVDGGLHLKGGGIALGQDRGSARPDLQGVEGLRGVVQDLVLGLEAEEVLNGPRQGEIGTRRRRRGLSGREDLLLLSRDAPEYEYSSVICGFTWRDCGVASPQIRVEASRSERR